MGGVTTTYDVMTRYMVQHHGEPVVQKMTTQVQALERSTEAAKASWGGMGRIFSMVGGYLGFQQANKHLLQFNSTMEQSQLQIAGMMAQAGRGDFASNLGTAATLMRQMRDDAAKTVGTTQDYVSMASMLVQPLTMAGASVADLRDMTRQTVVASRAMGIDATVSARDVDQAIRGVYHSVDQFTGKLLTPMGYGGEEGRRRFNLMPMEQRLAEVKRALGSKAIADMAGAQEKSFEGVTSTTKSILQEMLGKLGLPLFTRVKDQLYEWNTWLQRNESRVDSIARTIGDKLVRAAVTFKDAIGWAAEHWKSIAAAVAAVKAAGYLAGGSGGLLGAAAASSSGFVAGGAGSKIAAVSLVASAVYIGGVELANLLEKRHAMDVDRATKVDAATLGLLNGATTEAGRRALIQMMTTSGLATGSGLNTEEFRKAISTNTDMRGQWAQALGLQKSADAWGVGSEKIAEAMANRFAMVLRDSFIARGGILQDMVTPWNMMKDVQAGRFPGVEKPKVNVTIHKIEVASDDPDRWAFSFVDALRDAARNPSGVGRSVRVLREG